MLGMDTNAYCGTGKPGGGCAIGDGVGGIMMGEGGNIAGEGGMIIGEGGTMALQGLKFG
jgi:hypothetical protein